MKRYRVLSFDFDSRAAGMMSEIPEHWAEEVKAAHRRNREHVKQSLVIQLGEMDADRKLQDFIALGPKPLSILAFHNKFFEQIRVSFVMRSYYPALTGACALAERILNYLILTLREDFRATPQYKSVYRKDAFTNWDAAIGTLEAWDVLLPNVALGYRKLRGLRNDAIHFRPEVDTNDRQLLLFENLM